MKHLAFTILFSFYFSVNLFASDSHQIFAQETPTVYEQLCELNKYWQTHPEYQNLLNQRVDFADHEDLIQLHLMLVEHHLQQEVVAHLSPKQLKNRSETLEVLRAYWREKQFPQNTRHPHTIIPYFIDDFNTACAVGHLMRESGAVQEANWIAQTMNNAYIENMPLEKLEEWAVKMGFALEELKWIQPAYGIFSNEEVNHADCGDENGSIDMEVYMGECFEGEDMYVWYDYTGTVIQRVSSHKDLADVPAGFYRLQVNQNWAYSSECSHNRYLGISDIGGPQIDATVVQPSNEAADGMIELAISEGLPPYEIEWYDFNGNSLGNGATIRNLQGYPDMFMSQPLDFTHRVVVEDANGCKTFESFYLLGNIAQYPIPPFIPYIRNTIEGLATGYVRIDKPNFIFPPKELTYQWSHDPTLTSNEAHNLAAGNYTVFVTDIETQETYSQEFTILEETATNIADAELGNLKLYPTLTNQSVQIDLPIGEQSLEIQIFDHSGRKIYSSNMDSKQLTHTLEVNDYLTGIYFVNVRSEQGVYSGKFVKQ